MDNSIRIRAFNLLYKRLYCEDKVKSQEEFAEKIKRGKTYVSDMMNGNKVISNNLLKHLTKTIGTNDKFFDDPDNEQMFLSSPPPPTTAGAGDKTNQVMEEENITDIIPMSDAEMLDQMKVILGGGIDDNFSPGQAQILKKITFAILALRARL